MHDALAALDVALGAVAGYFVPGLFRRQEPPHGSLPGQPDRLPTRVRRRRRLRRLAGVGVLARGLFECPRGGHHHGWALRGKAHTFECARYHLQTSVTAGTILNGSRLALTHWFWAAYLMATYSFGVAAPEAARHRLLSHRLDAGRQAAPGDSRSRALPVVGSLVEVDETSLPFRSLCRMIDIAHPNAS